MIYGVRELKNIPACIAEIGAVIRLAFADAAEEFHLTPTNCPKHPSFLSDSDLMEPLSHPGVICFGALADSAIVGFAAIWPKTEDAFPGEPVQDIAADIYELARLCVLPAHRRAGLGARLLQAAVQAARERGAHKIEIGIIAENERLRRWYEGHGFRTTGVRVYAHLPFRVCEMEREE